MTDKQHRDRLRHSMPNYGAHSSGFAERPYVEQAAPNPPAAGAANVGEAGPEEPVALEQGAAGGAAQGAAGGAPLAPGAQAAADLVAHRERVLAAATERRRRERLHFPPNILSNVEGGASSDAVGIPGIPDWDEPDDEEYQIGLCHSPGGTLRSRVPPGECIAAMEADFYQTDWPTTINAKLEKLGWKKDCPKDAHLWREYRAAVLDQNRVMREHMSYRRFMRSAVPKAMAAAVEQERRARAQTVRDDRYYALQQYVDLPPEGDPFPNAGFAHNQVSGLREYRHLDQRRQVLRRHNRTRPLHATVDKFVTKKSGTQIVVLVGQMIFTLKSVLLFCVQMYKAKHDSKTYLGEDDDAADKLLIPFLTALGTFIAQIVCLVLLLKLSRIRLRSNSHLRCCHRLNIAVALLGVLAAVSKGSSDGTALTQMQELLGAKEEGWNGWMNSTMAMQFA